MASRSLIVMPDDTGKPILDAIAAAPEAIRIKIFLFSEPTLIAAVIAAHQRGEVEKEASTELALNHGGHDGHH
jgi:hypothetical protein